MLVDTHAHLMDPAFGDDLPEVLRRAEEAGVIAIVCVGYDEASSEQAIRLAETHPQIVAAVGVHPNYAGEAQPGAFRRICRLARHPRVVGIGETGLDNFRKRTPPAVQREWFHRHLDLAGELGIPVIVHNRLADEELVEILPALAARMAERMQGVLHCFSGGRELLIAGLNAGFLVSFAGPVTFKNAGDLLKRARETPLDNIVVETDCPYLTPSPRRGQRNEPAFVGHTLERIAELRGISVQELAKATTRNALRTFARLQVAAA